MKNKLAIALLFSAGIIAVGLTVPKLPAPRYIFKEVERKDAYTNYAFPTLIYDTWTGEVRYVAEGRFQEEGKEKDATYSAQGRILNEGKELIAVLTERYLLLLVIGLLVVLGFYFMSKAPTNKDPNLTPDPPTS